MAIAASDTHLASSDMDVEYRPPSITPPTERYGAYRSLRAAIRNPITLWPEELYDSPILVNRHFGRQMAHIADPTLARRVLLEDADSFHRARLMMATLGPALGDGLLTSDGAHWRRQRRIAAPAFRMQELRALTPSMARAGAEAAKRMARSTGGIVDVMPHMVHATFDVIADAIIGTETDADLLDRPGFARDVDLYLNTVGKVGLMDILGAPNWVPRVSKLKALGAMRRVRAAAARVVAARRSAGAESGTLADRLIRAVDPEGGAGLTDKEVVDNIITFFGAGHETTAMALTWTLSILAHQPAWQNALRDEARSVAGDAPISAEHVDALTLHAQVVKEAIRLYPPAAVFGRKAVAEVRVGDVTLEPGDEAVIAVYVMHRSRALWDRPDMFDPTRFAPDAPAIDRFAYLPFGGGPRICIGMHFALIEAAAMLAEILRRVRLTPGPTSHAIEPLLRITLRPKGGMPLGVEAI